MGRKFAIASMVLFGVSLFPNAFYIDRPDNPAGPGSGLLLVGCLGVFVGAFAWLANPLLVATWALTFSRPPRAGALACAAASLAFALSFLLHHEIMLEGSGKYSRITGYGPGYWLWVASIATALVGCLVAAWLGRTSQGGR